MASKRKRQVGGTPLPKTITFRIYPQPDKEFTDSDDFVSKRKECEAKANACDTEIANCNSSNCAGLKTNCDSQNKTCSTELTSIQKLSSICPAKWHTVTKAEKNIHVKIPNHFVVTATCPCLGIANTFREETDVFKVLHENYTFTIEYAKETANLDINGVSNILANTEGNADIHPIVVKSQSTSISLDELRKIMNYYFFKLDKNLFNTLVNSQHQN